MPMLSSYKDVCKSLKRDVSKALAASSRVQSSKKLKQSFEEKAEANPKYRNAVVRIFICRKLSCKGPNFHLSSLTQRKNWQTLLLPVPN